MQPDLPQSRTVLCTERRSRVEERRVANDAFTHAVAADGRHQTELLLDLYVPPQILSWSSV